MKERGRHAEQIRELAKVEGTLAARPLIQPWTHVIIAIASAVMAWIIPIEDVRATAFGPVAYLPLFAAVIAVPLGRTIWLFNLPEDEEPDAADGGARRGEPGPAVYMWGVGISIALAGGIGAVGAFLIPASWIRWVLPVLALWAVLEATRRDRGHYKRAHEQYVAAQATPVWEDYQAVMRERRERSRGRRG
ncbi:hypothetical protein AB0D49_20935 [Streptomyces sp. NPDC048290]|uniref:hypothetical protein n=1 Tax=Streptomyces sp. NPDC048290 TaxID=3155811 RepID=UPI00343D7AAB